LRGNAGHRKPLPDSGAVPGFAPDR